MLINSQINWLPRFHRKFRARYYNYLKKDNYLICTSKMIRSCKLK